MVKLRRFTCPNFLFLIIKRFRQNFFFFFSLVQVLEYKIDARKAVLDMELGKITGMVVHLIRGASRDFDPLGSSVWRLKW